MAIHQVLAEARTRVGLTQDAVGQQLGVSGATVSRWEHGEFLPRVDRLVAWGRVVGVEVVVRSVDPRDPFEALRAVMTVEEARATLAALTVVKKMSV